MSITSIGSLGNGVVGGTGSANCTLTTSAAIEAGNVALLWWSSENSSTSDGNSSEHTSVTDSAGAVSWTKLYEYCNANGAADAGITTSLWYRPKQGSDLATSSTITGTRVDSRLDQTMLAWEFATTYDLIDDTSGPVGNVTDASNGFGSASFSSLTSTERLYFRALGKKANVASTTDLTPSTSFTICSNIRSRNNAAATLARGEFRINTSTGETSNPTFAFSGDTAAIFVGLVEDVPVTAAPTPIIVPAPAMAHIRRRQLLRRPLGTVLMPAIPITGASNPTIIAETGAYTLTGNAAGLKVGRQIAAGLGAFTLTGNAATLTYSGGSGAYTLIADAGTFTLTGNAAALRVSRMLAAATGGFTLTGIAAGLRASRVLTASQGTFTLTGNAASLTYSGAGTTFTLTAQTGTFTLTGNAAGLRLARQLIAATGSYTLTGNAAGLTYSGALLNLGQYLIELLGLDRWRLTDHTLTRYNISEPAMPTTVTTASAYLWLTEDQEAEFEFSRKNATTGALEAATGLTGMTVHIAASAGGSAIGALTFNLSERGTTGIYYAVMDTATLVAGLSTSSYPDGTAVYLVVSKSGDIASRSFRKIVKRQRIGDG